MQNEDHLWEIFGVSFLIAFIAAFIACNHNNQAYTVV
jgi:hypothetical protein